jgi:pimeloyl-ACP methyl ester carboxylesterase
MVSRRHAFGRVAVATLAVLTSALARPTSASAGGSGCAERPLRVSLAEASPAKWTVWGRLCGPGSDVVEVLTHGITYSHTYWDWPYRPEVYSYVRRAGREGRTTFTYDRIGIGRSDHPPAQEITLQADAEVLHQIVAALRSGLFGRRFGRVTTVGHSLGSLITMIEASRYHDTDGLVLTGISHTFLTDGVAKLFPDFVPAETDPTMSRRGLPPGYVTTRAATRLEHFYYAPTAQPDVVTLDEATKETGTVPELATIPTGLPVSTTISAPVVVINGDNDQLVCGSTPCSSLHSQFQTERFLYPDAPAYEQVLISGMGHVMTIQMTAPAFFDAVSEWIGRHGLKP